MKRYKAALGVATQTTVKVSGATELAATAQEHQIQLGDPVVATQKTAADPEVTASSQ
jgi:hypothetical protein